MTFPKIQSLILLMLCTFVVAKSQILTTSLIGSSGDSFKTSSFQIDFAIGEIDISTFSQEDRITTQGLFQELKIMVGLSNEVKRYINLYPNPFKDHIFIEVKDPVALRLVEEGSCSVTITDLLGKIQLKSKLSGANSQIFLETLSPGMYVLSLRSNNNILQSYQVIKL